MKQQRSGASGDQTGSIFWFGCFMRRSQEMKRKSNSLLESVQIKSGMILTSGGTDKWNRWITLWKVEIKKKTVDTCPKHCVD